MIPAFIINLPSSKDRRESCLSCLKKANIEGQVFEATYGKDVLASLENDPNSPYKDKILLTEQLDLTLSFGVKVSMKDKLTAGEIGCALSHLQLYEHIVKNNIEYALILEDDAEVTENVGFIIEEALKRKNLWDIFFIYHDSGVRDFGLNKPIYLDDKKEFYIKKEGVGWLDPIFNRRRLIYVASCYMVSLQTAKKLLDLGYPLRVPADFLIGFLAYNKLRAYIAQPREKLCKCFGNFDSVIDNVEPRGDIHHLF